MPEKDAGSGRETRNLFRVALAPIQACSDMSACSFYCWVLMAISGIGYVPLTFQCSGNFSRENFAEKTFAGDCIIAKLVSLKSFPTIR